MKDIGNNQIANFNRPMIFSGRSYIYLRSLTRCSIAIILLASFACSNEKKSESRALSTREKMFYDNKGVGPVQHIILDPVIDLKKAEAGEKIFNSKCISCHEMNEERRIGPGLKNITQRRRPEWILNMILNPMEMTKKDSLSKELLLIYMAQMTPMNVSNEEAIEILEYFRKTDNAAGKR